MIPPSPVNDVDYQPLRKVTSEAQLDFEKNYKKIKLFKLFKKCLAEYLEQVRTVRDFKNL